MQNDYTNSEICRIYRNQEDRAVGVKNLCQLTGWSKERIEQILTDGGYTDFKIYKHKNRTGGHKSRIIDEVALTMYNNKCTDAQIAEQFGLKKDAIRKWRNDKNLPSLHVTQLEKLHNDIEDCLNKGYGITKISKLLKVHENTIHNWIRRNHG